MSEWQPIETAPRDGSRFRARGHDWGAVNERRRQCDAEWIEDGWNGAGFYTPSGELHLRYIDEWKPICLTPSLPLHGEDE